MHVRAVPVVAMSLLLVVAPAFGAVGPVVEGPAEEAVPLDGGEYEDHPPIRIHGDDDFESPLSGVVSGSGTEEDPYVIEGWRIQPLHIRMSNQGSDDGVGKLCEPAPAVSTDWWRTSRHHGIEIVGTSAHVVIRNNFVHARDKISVQGRTVDSRDLIGVFLKNADNVRIENNSIGSAEGTELFRGICAEGATNLEIRENSIQRTIHTSVSVKKSSMVTIDGNHILESSGYGSIADGIELNRVNGATVHGNVLNGHQSASISVFSGGNHVIQHNTMTDSRGDGLYMQDVSGPSISYNVVAWNEDDGIRLVDSSNVRANFNNIHDNGLLGVRNGFDPTDAEHNWWGCEDGPGNPGCDEVDVNVDSNPYLSSPEPDAGA